MFIEYYINNIEEKDIDTQLSIEKTISYGVKNILCPINQCRYIKKNFNDNLNLGCLIDYPLAFSDIDKRVNLINDAISLKVNYISITIPFYHMINRKYTKLREDIKKNLDICNTNNINLRYMLEYRKFDYQLLAKVCDILMENGVTTIYPSTGIFIDNINDNIIACVYLKDKTGINTIVNGNIWNKSHVDSVQKIDPYGISLNQISSIQLLV